MSELNADSLTCPACLKGYLWSTDRAGRKAMCTCGLIVRFPNEPGSKLIVVGRKPPEVKPDKHGVVNQTAFALEIEELNDRSKVRPPVRDPDDEENHPEHRRHAPSERRPDAPPSSRNEKSPVPFDKNSQAKGICPKCGVVMARKATVCMACGYDLVAKKQVGPVADPNDDSGSTSAVWVKLSGFLPTKKTDKK